MSPLEWALAYVRRFDWPVFPRPNGRFIEGGHGFKDATRDERQITEWWTEYPRAWVCLPTGPASGIVVLDLDDKDERDGFATLERLGKSLPDTPRTHTPHHGIHAYFADNPHVSIGCSVDALGVGLDVKGHGGSVPLPTPGNGYVWAELYRPGCVPFHPAPGWFATKRRANGNSNGNGALDADAVLKAACDAIGEAAPGQRNETLNRQAFLVGALVKAGAVNSHDAKRQLTAAAALMIARTGGDTAKTEYDLERAFKHGKIAGKWGSK